MSKTIDQLMSIGTESADEFEGAFRSAMLALNPALLEYLCLSSPLSHHHGVQISFDARGRPFLGFTRGYNNHSKPPRAYFPYSCTVLEVVAECLRNSGRTTGGRVFLNERGIQSNFESIARWSWRGASPQDRAFSTYRQLLDSARTMAA